MSNAYRVIKQKYRQGAREFEFALIDPNDETIGRSWSEVNLSQRCDDLNKAFELGFRCGYAAKERQGQAA